MEKNCEHGDIFYVRNGHWYGLYTENKEPSFIIYPEDLCRVVKFKNFEPLKYGSRIHKIHEDHHFYDNDIVILGNIFKLAEEYVEEAKIAYDKAVETCKNVEDLIRVKDRRFKK